MKGRRIMMGMSFIDPKYIQEGEFDKMPETTKKQTGHHSRKLAAVLLAACLVFALAATAYATDLFGLKDMYRTPYQELPQEAEPYIQKETAAAEAEEGWSCEITESLADNTTVMATVTIRGGDKYIIVPTDANPEDSVGIIGIAGSQTLSEYAAAQGKKLLMVGASIKEIGGQETAGGSQRMENRSDSEMVILTQTNKPASASGTDAVCVVYAREADSNDVQRENLSFTLGEAPTVGDERVYHPLKADGLPGLKANELTVTQTALGYSIRLSVTVTDEELFWELMKYEFDGITWGEFSGTPQPDGTWCYQWNMCQGTVGGSLILRAYDTDKNPMGEVEFRELLN